MIRTRMYLSLDRSARPGTSFPPVRAHCCRATLDARPLCCNPGDWLLKLVVSSTVVGLWR